MFDNPLTFLILISVISAISDWLGKRRKAAREREVLEQGGVEIDQSYEIAEQVPQADSRPSLRERKQEWEERLRRMLEGDQSPETPTQSPVQPRPSEAPESEYLFGDARESMEASPAPLPVFDTQLSPETDDRSASQRVADISTDVTLSKPAPPMQVRRRKRSHGPSVVNFQSKDEIRKAIIASVALGSPKGLGEESDIIPL